MADLNKNIVDLDPVPSTLAGDTFVVAQGSDAKRCTINQMATFLADDATLQAGVIEAVNTNQLDYISSDTFKAASGPDYTTGRIFEATALAVGTYSIEIFLSLLRVTNLSLSYLATQIPSGNLKANIMRGFITNDVGKIDLAGPSTAGTAINVSQTNSGTYTISIHGRLIVNSTGDFLLVHNSPLDDITYQAGSYMKLRKIA